MSVSNWQRNAQLFTALNLQTSTIGTYVGRTPDGLAEVNVYDSTITVRVHGKYLPWPGDGVILEVLNGDWFLTGPTAAKNSIGTITAIEDPFLSIQVDQRAYKLPYTVSYQSSGPKVNDSVSINWDGNYVIDKLTATPTSETVDTKLTTDQKPFTLNFFAKQSGSYKHFAAKGHVAAGDRWWTEDVYADDDDTAAWWYGKTIMQSLKDDAYISSLEIFLPIRRKKGAEPALGHHSQEKQTTGSVSIDDSATYGREGWVTLPVAWANTWRTAVGGVGVHHGGESIYAGIGSDTQSGKLRIRGRQ